MIAITRDKAGKQFEKCVIGSNKILNGMTTKIASSSVYLHYPLEMNGVELIGNFDSSYYNGTENAIDGVTFTTECSRRIR